MSDYMDFLGNLRKTHGKPGEEDAEGETLFDNASEAPEEPEEPEVPAEKTRGSRRHIRTKKAVSVSVSEDRDDSEIITADKYTDRFTFPEEEPQRADEKTRRLHTYSDVRANDADAGGKTRHISISELTGKRVQSEEIPEDIPAAEESDKGSRLRAIAETAHDDYEGEQLVMPGFTEKKEDERTPEDVELEEKLSAVRKERIRKFKLTGAQSGGTLSGEHARERVVPGFLRGMAATFEKHNTDFSPCSGDEFTDLAQRRRIFTGLVKLRQKVLFRIIAVGINGIILLVLNITAAAAASPAGELTLFGGSAAAYTAVNLILFLVACGICFEEMKKGFISLLQIRPKSQGAAVLMSLGVIAQCIGAFITKRSLATEVQLFTGSAALMLIPLLYSKVFYYDNARHCFKAISSGGEKSVVRQSNPGDGVNELVGNSDKDFCVVYEGKTSFITGFLARASRAAHAGMPSSRLVLIGCLICIVVAVADAVITKSPVGGLTALAACMCLTFPVSGLFGSSLMLSRKNCKLASAGSYVQSFADARDFSNADYIAVDAHELFDVSVHDVTAFSGLSEKQAGFCAAALAIRAGGTLGRAFSSQFGEYADKLPEAQELSYEDKLGLSAWVNNCRMLLGTRSLLENHNVKLPSQSVSDSFTDGGTLPVYMSIEEKLTAIFSIDYNCNAALAEKLRKLVSSGTSIIVFTNDANINEHMIERKFGLPENSVKVVSSFLYSEFEAEKNTVSPGEDTGIVFKGGFSSLCECAVTAGSLDRMKRLSKTVCAGGCIAGILIGAMAAFSGSLGKVSSLHVLILQCAMLLITSLLCGMSDRIALPRRNEKRTPPADGQPQQPQEPEKAIPQEKGGFTGDIFKGLLSSSDDTKDIFPEL